jgi:hypothetical protein
MADPEQPKENADEPKDPAAAGDVQASSQTKPDRTDTSAPIPPKHPAPPLVGPVQTTPPPPPAPATPTLATVPKRRFWVNLVLCVLLVTSMGFWFLWHLQPWFARALLGGIVLVIVPLIYGTFTLLAGEEMKAFPAKVLGARWARRVIIILFIASVGLHFLTSSIYVEYAGASADTKDCTVEILNAASGQRFIEPITATSENKFAGRPFFFRIFPTELRFKLTDPPGHQQKIEKLRLAKRILLRAPADFPEKHFHILRVVFGPLLWSNLAEPDDAASTYYDLQMSIGGKEMRIDDVRRQTINVGAASDDIEYVLKHEDMNDRKSDFVEQLSKLGIPSEHQQGWIDAWESKRRVVATDEHPPGEAITITLRRRGIETPIAREETKKMTASTIQTIVLEKQ